MCHPHALLNNLNATERQNLVYFLRSL